MIIIKEDFEKFLDYVHLRINLWDPQFLTKIVFDPLQLVRRSKKQTVLWTLPSSTVGWEPSNQPGRVVPHLYAGTRVVGILFPQLPQDDTIPQRVGCHISLNRQVLRNLSFYWHHSGFYNDSMDRLQIEIIITTGLGLLEMTTTLKKERWSNTCVGHFRTMRLRNKYGK